MGAQQLLDAVNAAIANGGVVRVKMPDGAEIQWSTLTELLNARSRLESEIAVDAGDGMFVQAAFGDPRQ